MFEALVCFFGYRQDPDPIVGNILCPYFGSGSYSCVFRIRAALEY